MTDRKEATAFLKEAVKIQRQVEKVEKERSLGAQCKRNGWTEGFVELEDHEKTRRYERDAEKIRLQKELTKIQNVVQKFQTQLIDVKPTPRLIQKLKEIMTEVEISIVSFKMDQRSCFEQLIKDEKIFFQEIAACEKKIENWSLGVNSDAKPTSAAAFKGSRPSNADHPPEVKALESFLLQTGGCHGGWDQDDHQIFLRVRTKHSARPAFKREAKLYLPGKSVEDVEQHEGWYLELVGLQDKKREAIQRWKNARQRERRGRLEGREEEKERKEEKTKVQAPQHRSEEGRKEAALQLEEWKEKKKRQEEQGEEQRRAEEVTEKRRAKEERRKQLDVKLTLEELLRLRREEEEEQEMKRREDQQREVEERRSEAAVGIKRSQERDFQKVEARLRERQLREQQEADRQKRIVAKTKEKQLLAARTGGGPRQP